MEGKIVTRHQTKEFKIDNGTDGTTVDINVWDGEVIGAVIELDGDFPAQLVNVSIKDNGGHRIEDGTSLKNWKQRQGGNYRDSLKPLSIKGNQTIKFAFDARSNLAAELKGQIILLIEQHC